MDVAPREERIARHVKQSVVLLSAQGQRFTQKVAAELALLDRIVLVCGRYEGVDERVADFLADRELSIGDYVLSGGEMAAAVIVEAVMRLLPGAVGNERSTQQESFTVDSNATDSKAADSKAKDAGAADSTCGSNGLLDYPHYTRPAEFRGIKVPEELMSGNHEEIRKWRRQQALEKTFRNRPDLLEGAALSEEDNRFLAKIKKEEIKKHLD